MSSLKRCARFSTLAVLLGGTAAVALVAQEPITRAQATATALARGTRAAFGRADTAAAAGALHAARLYPNPLVSASYTKDVPHYHAVADLPLDLPWIRSARIGAAASARDAARYGFAFERAAIRFDVDTTYTRALAAHARARLSRRTALDADSLLRMAQLRREVGDVSELDVRLAAVNAGQLANAAADDSLAAIEALLAVQLAMGLPAEEMTIMLADSLAPPLNSVPSAIGEPLPVAAAAASLRSSERALSLAHRSVFATPSLQIGFDQGDPTGPPGALPLVGLSLPLPLFNWNGGEIAQATAGRDRAQANLEAVRRSTSAELARARRGFALALTRLERNRQLLASANRVAEMSLQAYAEGAVALPNVLEAQRNAREALARYIDDVAAANNAAAAVRLLAVPDEP
jgi:cobalt-zinc-cadmium efflux system outer membrane protein